MRIKPGEDSTAVLVEFGDQELERTVPANQGVSRMSVILDATGKLSDVELVTARIE